MNGCGEKEGFPMTSSYRWSLASVLVAAAVLRAGASQGADPFVFYAVRGSTAAPVFAPFGPVTLADDLSGGPYSVVKPRQLGVAGDTGGGVSDAGAAAVEYAIAPFGGSTEFRIRSGVRVATQCGDVSVALKKPTSLLVPATIQGTTVPPGSESDRFLCYRVGTEKRLADGTPAPRLARGTQVDVQDRFQTRRYDLLAVTKVCRPVDESSDAASPPSILRGSAVGSTKPVENAAIRDPGQAFVCYRAKLSTRYVRQAGCGPADPDDRGTPIVPSQAPHARRTVATTDEFGLLGLETIRANEVCLPLATADADRDGVRDSDDPCPDTVSGASAVFPGCSALDVIENADRLVAPLHAMIGALRKQIEGDVELGGLDEIMGALPSMLDDAARATRGADPCLGQTTLAGVEQAIDTATGIATAVRYQARLNALVTHPDGDDDFNEDDARVADLDTIVGWTAGLRTSTSTIRDAFAETCRTGTPNARTRGVVSRLLEGRRRIELTDGRVFGLAQPIVLEQKIWEGLTLDIDGLVFGPTGVATDASPVSGVQQYPDLPYDDCLRLRVVPIQPFPPYGSGPYKLLDPKGYETNSTLYLEVGMRLAAVSVCNPTTPSNGTFVRHSLRIEEWPADDPGGTIAARLRPGDDPVPLSPVPGWGQLYVYHDAQTCQFVDINLNVACNNPVALSKEVIDVKLMQDGSLCAVTYDSHYLDVNDQIPSDFRVTTLKDVLLDTPQDPNTSPIFEAEGYGYNGWTTFPTVVPIVGQQTFAVHNTDFTTVGYQTITGVLDWKEFALRAQNGVDHAAALRWPHVRATRNGKEYQYSCRLPDITRDVVDFCNGSTHAYYRLPWAPEDTTWSIGQGDLPNCPDSPQNPQGYCYKAGSSNCTHAGGYALDLIAPCMQPFRAARAGRVYSVKTDSMQNSKPAASCPVDNGDACGTTDSCNTNAGANVLTLQYQDGSLGLYVHPNLDKILPKLGDYVKRGQLVGWVGMTGNTTGPHLHFQSRTGPGGKSRLSLFQAIDPDDGNKLLHCYEPKSDPGNTCYSYTPKALRSNNKKQ
jgi:hypothetical protein